MPEPAPDMLPRTGWGGDPVMPGDVVARASYRTDEDDCELRGGNISSRRLSGATSWRRARDGCVLISIGEVGLRALQRAAQHGDCTLADMLLALFGLALDRVDWHKDTSIAVLAPDVASTPDAFNDGTHRALADEDDGGMPLDMRRAIASTMETVSPRLGGVAFRHTRRRPGQEPSGSSAPLGLGGYDVLLEVGEFDAMLMLECRYSTPCTSEQAAVALLRAFADELATIAAATVGLR